MSDFSPIKSDAILEQFFTSNSNFQLLNFNFFDEAAVTALNWKNLDKDEIDRICDRLKAYQRLFNLGLNAEEAMTQLGAEEGDSAVDTVSISTSDEEQDRANNTLDSALAIASLSEEEYVEVSGITPEKAREYHHKATQTIAGEMMLLANAMEVGSPRYETMRADNTEEIRKQFSSLPSYQKLFGSLDFLQCDPCQSIFSPSAYFVDLMRIVEEKITGKNDEIPEKFLLNKRRPDLQNIPLTCDNTKDTVPYTQIVSEVLAEKLKNGLDKDIFQHLATAKYPRNLPFNLYLEQIRTYLGHLDTNLADIYQICNPQDRYSKTWAREYLGLSPEEYTLITIANTEDVDLKARFGIVEEENGWIDRLKNKKAFLEQTKLSWQQLNELLYQNLSKGEIEGKKAHQFYINQTLSDENYLHLTNEGVIENLDSPSLDRIDRFLRLAHKLNWSFTDLDWVLTSIGVNENNQNDIDENAIINIAKIKQLQSQTKLPLDVLCSFWHDMKTIGQGDRENLPQDLFNRIYNNHFTLQGQNEKSDKDIKMEDKQHLLGALKLSDEALTEILKEIGENQDETDSIEVKLNLSNLSKLFRIAQVLKLLGLKVDEYKLLLKFLGKPQQLSEKYEIDLILELIELTKWLKLSGFSVYELDYIINEVEHHGIDVFLPEEKMAAFMESLWKTEWQLSLEDYKLITTENYTPESLSERFNVQIESSDDNFGGLTEKRTFLEKTNLSKEKLADLLDSNVSGNENKQGRFYINKPSSDKEIVALEGETIDNLSLERLDRIDRFLRLARVTEWSFADLDRVLAILDEKYNDEEAIKIIFQIKRTKRSLTPKDFEDKLVNFLQEINQEFNIKLAHHFGIEPDLFSILAQICIKDTGETDYTQFLLTQVNTGEDARKKISEYLKAISRWCLLVNKLALTETVSKSIHANPEAYNIDSRYKLNIQNIQTIYNTKYQLLTPFRGSEENLKKILILKDPSPIRYWSLDEGIGREVYEQEGNSKNTLAGNFTWEHSIPFPDNTIRNVLNFKTGTFIDIGSTSSLNLIQSDFTIEAWVYPTVIDRIGIREQKRQGILYQSNNPVNPIGGLCLGLVDRKVSFSFKGLHSEEALGKKELENNKWYHIVWRYNISSKEQAIFINGNLNASYTGSDHVKDRPEPIFVGTGWHGGYNHFHGYIANLRIWDEALSDDLISKRFINPAQLAGFTGWQQEKIEQIINLFQGQKLYKSVRGLLKVDRCIALSNKLGCSIDLLGELCVLLENKSAQNNWETYQQLAKTVVSLAKAKHNDSEWTKVFAKLNGSLEERKAKILTDYALWKLNLENLRQLSEYLLLDVEMSSCACNSKIQLGILSLQTYLQRCRLGLEPGVTNVNISEVEWEWIPNYRKWEANRKVFLYPENYIDPSLRQDASPQFKELQDELLQSEITADTVETAYRHYFDKLTEIGNLQIVEGCRYDVKTPKSDQAIDTLFLFGKTVTQPHTFYYRRCEHPTNDKPSWGYWEKIDLQINSDYLSSVYAFNRLFIFWVETKEIEKEPGKKTTEVTIKFSFLNASQQWISPQTLVEDVEIPQLEMSTLDNDRKNEFLQKFWRQVSPTACSESIAIEFGNIQGLDPAKMMGTHMNNQRAREEICTLTNLDKLAPIIGSDLLPASKLRKNLPTQSEEDTNNEINEEIINKLTDTVLTLIKKQSQISILKDDFIAQKRSEAYLCFLNETGEYLKHIIRLATIATQQFSQILFAKGIDGLLSLESQLISEPDFPSLPSSSTLDFNGAYGAYFWEIFFHIPFLIGSTLNSHQRYKEARQWYQYIFNPILQRKMIAYWPLNEGKGNEVIDRVSNKSFVLEGKDKEIWATYQRDSPKNSFRKELYLNFSSPRIFINIGSTLSLQIIDSSFTIEAWIFLTNLASSERQGILCVPSTKSGNEENALLFLGLINGQVSFSFNGLEAEEARSTRTLEKKYEWYHVEGQYNAFTKEQSIFIDGELDCVRKNVEPLKDIKSNVYVGFGHQQGQNNFRGGIANLRIWNVPLHDGLNIWRFLPFKDRKHEKLHKVLTNSAAIQAYKEKPFDPHAIANLRVGAYEKAVVMKYIDNLLDWGDALFTEDNWESIAQATTLYLLAYELLGEKPKNLGQPPARKAKKFTELPKFLAKNENKGTLSEFLIDLENRPEYTDFIKQFGDAVPFNALDAYFCISENQEFAQYWDRVEDRLFKIRHCQNIKGIERQLVLFSPPIDPRQLVRQVAAAGAASLSLATSNIIPHYRFSYLLERAKGMVSTVIQLGSTLLSTLEKKDAEELALLRATQEPVLLQLITKTKEKQIEEAEANKKSLEKSKESAKSRQTHYKGLIDRGLNVGEISSLDLVDGALTLQDLAAGIRVGAAFAYLSPVIYGTSNGGMKLGEAVEVASRALDSVAGTLNQRASMISTIAQFERRQEDWALQQKMADWDVQQIEEQIKAADVRIEIAKAELNIHHKSIEHSREIEQFLRGKFTNKELYQWMVGRLSSLYFQTYKIALDMANSTQKAYQYELNKDDTYIQPTHWDSQKKGLLAGESLMLGLNQLEKAYIDGNERDLEIEKTISVRQIAPSAFLELIEKGKCKFSFLEKHFAFDFPGHYCRQIKTISISIPAVVGPYQNINATLKQTSDKVLVKSDGKAAEWLLDNSQDNTTDFSKSIRQGWRNNQQIALSKGTNDSGMFELNFRDERYLPFEGTGAVSSWELSLPKATNRFDFKTISDVIITLSYTALDGGDTFRQEVTNIDLLKKSREVYKLNLKEVFPSEWQAFMTSNTDKSSQKLNFHISSEIIPPHIKDPKLTGIIFRLDANDIVSSPMSFSTIKIGENDVINSNGNSINETVADNWFRDWVINFDLTKVPNSLKKNEFLNSEIVNNIELILTYEGTINWEN